VNKDGKLRKKKVGLHKYSVYSETALQESDQINFIFSLLNYQKLYGLRVLIGTNYPFSYFMH